MIHDTLNFISQRRNLRLKPFSLVQECQTVQAELGSFILLNECKIWKNYRAKCRSKGTSAEKFLYTFVDLEYEHWIVKFTKTIGPHFNTFLCKFMGYIFLNISPAIHCTFLTTFSIEEKITTKKPKCRFNIGILKKSSTYESDKMKHQNYFCLLI